MAMIGLNLYITGLTGKLIIRWVKASAPLAEVGRNDNPSLLTFPYDAVYTIPDLAKVVYKVQLWRSDDGIALDQLLKEWPIMAGSGSGSSAVKYYQYKVGRGWTNVTQDTGDLVWADPENGDVSLIDERLEGFTQDQIIFHEVGVGNKLSYRWELLPGGGITLLDGFTFDTDVEFTAETLDTSEAVEDTEDTQSPGAPYAGVEEITADSDFDTTLYDKLVNVASDGPRLQVNIPDLTLIPDGKHVTFNTHKGTQNYLVLQFDVGDTVRANNQDVNVLYIPKNQTISLFFWEGECIITTPTDFLLKRGTILMDYDLLRANTLAVIAADEATGELDKFSYEGLYAYINGLTGTAVATLGSAVGQWGYSNAGVFENKRKFGIDTGTEKIRVPHLTGVTPKFGTTPGTYEADSVGALTFNVDYKQGKSDDNESGVSGEYLRKPGASGGSSYGNTTVSYSINVGAENKVKSVIQKAYIIL